VRPLVLVVLLACGGTTEPTGEDAGAHDARVLHLPEADTGEASMPCVLTSGLLVSCDVDGAAPL
jgi:hypothetical protein